MQWTLGNTGFLVYLRAGTGIAGSCGCSDAYEIVGPRRGAVLARMTPKQQVRVPVSLIAAVPGKYTGPPAANTCITAANKAWVDGFKAEVAAKEVILPPALRFRAVEAEYAHAKQRGCRGVSRYR